VREAKTTMLSRLETLVRSQPNPAAFEICRQELDRHTSLVTVEGELDLSTAPRLKWTLIDSLQTGLSRLIVDLSRVAFMDSTALGVLVGVKRKLEEGERLAIVCPRRDLLKIFEFAGMDGAFAIFPTLEEALANVREDAVPPG
jgi:anti-sigma B factor antagonist